MPKAFFLTSGPPLPVVGARRLRDAQIISLLAERMDVELFCVEDESATPELQRVADRLFPGSRVRVTCHPLDRPSFAIRALNRVRPHFAQGYSDRIERDLYARARPGDLIWLSRLRMGKYIPIARHIGAKVVLDEHQVESDLLFDNAFAKARYWSQGVAAAQCALYERGLCHRADVVVTGSTIDAARMLKLAQKSRVHVIPPGVFPELYDDADAETAHSPMEFLFFGDLDYEPNVHALEWFVAEVMPRLNAALREHMPEIIAAGSNIPDGLEEKFPRIRFRHYDDPLELGKMVARAAVAFFPLRYGRGNRVAILEAMASGAAIVSTGKAADGLVLRPSQDLLIADHADDFTSSLLRLMKNPDLRRSLEESAVRTARDRFGWQKSRPAMDGLMKLLGMPCSPVGSPPPAKP